MTNNSLTSIEEFSDKLVKWGNSQSWTFDFSRAYNEVCMRSFYLF